MTTNVPQDVIDELEKISQDIASAGIHGFGNQISDAVSKLRDQRAGGEAVALVAPKLKEGELYAGILLGKNGSADQHIILLPGDNDEADHADSTAWADSIGGELPTRREQSLLFANLKEEFQDDWYWSCETYAAYADYAWYQGFYGGYQFSNHKGSKLRARAVRRVTI